MNRGSDAGDLPAEAGQIASMRPRFMNRGSVFRHRAVPRRVRGFNEAPIHESGKLWESATMIVDPYTLQ